MLLTVTRRWFTDKSTIGTLSIDNVQFCYTLEDVVRAPGVKIPGETAIPEGTYQLSLRWSNKHGCNVPHVEDVPNFAEIEVHWGNKAVDTEGCLLVGKTHGVDFISTSKETWAALMHKIANTMLHEEVLITYRSERAA